jgi:transcriptional regulator with XRE-family HTH domain
MRLREGEEMDNFYVRFGKKIKALREQIGISQQRLSELLHIPRPAISQIESGERKISAEELKRLSEIFYIPVDNLLDLEREPEVILKETKKRERIKNQIRINVPQKNLEKFKEVFLYILKKVGAKPNIGETVVYKLLYFIDFDFYSPRL